MAQSKPEPKTERTYVILAGTKNPGSPLFEVGRTEAASAKAAVAEIADPSSPQERYVAIPARSFSVFEGKVEQPPPVFRFQEVGTIKTVIVDKNQKPVPVIEPTEPSPETPRLPAESAQEAAEALTALTAAGRVALEDDGA